LSGRTGNCPDNVDVYLPERGLDVFIFLALFQQHIGDKFLERVHIFQVKVPLKFFDSSEKKVKTHSQLCLIASCAIATWVILPGSRVLGIRVLGYGEKHDTIYHPVTP